MVMVYAGVMAGVGLAFLCAMPAGAVPGGRPDSSETVVAQAGDIGEAPMGHAMPQIPPAPDAGDNTGDPLPRIAAPETPAGPLAEPEAVPNVEYDFSKLPPPVQRLREQIQEAAKSGNPDMLRPIFNANGGPPEFGAGEVNDDPVAFLKSLSGDADGREILAILIEVLDAGYVHVDVGTPQEMYVWPYFARYPIDKLSGPQIVELFKLIYAGDWEDMRNEGHYLFYRMGIDPEGKWRYFTSGD